MLLLGMHFKGGLCKTPYLTLYKKKGTICPEKLTGGPSSGLLDFWDYVQTSMFKDGPPPKAPYFLLSPASGPVRHLEDNGGRGGEVQPVRDRKPPAPSLFSLSRGCLSAGNPLGFGFCGGEWKTAADVKWGMFPQRRRALPHFII